MLLKSCESRKTWFFSVTFIWLSNCGHYQKAVKCFFLFCGIIFLGATTAAKSADAEIINDADDTAGTALAMEEIDSDEENGVCQTPGMHVISYQLNCLLLKEEILGFVNPSTCLHHFIRERWKCFFLY